MDNLLSYVMLTGLALVGIGFLVLLIVAFRVRWWWGLLLILFPPLALVFVILHPRPSVVPATILFIGVFCSAGPVAYSRYHPVDLGPLERNVDGELHLTLTGWDRKDYSILRQRPHVVVLQMANPDVDDRVLDNLVGVDRLRELDLNHSKVTDAGLKLLAGIPTLETLRLANTGVTDAGFRDSLAGLPSLKQLDLRGTRVSREVVQAWKEARSGRRVLQ